MPNPPLPIHPALFVGRSERKAFAVWLGSRRKHRLPPACYGLWKWLAPIGHLRGLEAIRSQSREAAAISAANRRARPEWCSETTWRRWRAYQRMVCAGIPLEVYADPVQRAAWKHKAGIRSAGTRAARAEEILLRKGLHPSQRRGGMSAGYLANPRFEFSASSQEIEKDETLRGLTAHPQAVIDKINRKLLERGIMPKTRREKP